MLALLLNPHLAMLAVLPMATTSTDVFQQVANYGLAGIVVVLLMTGRLHTTAEVDGLKEALRDAIDRERKKDIAMGALMQQIATQTVPSIERMSQVIEALNEQHPDTDLTGRMEALADKIEKIERRAR